MSARDRFGRGLGLPFIPDPDGRLPVLEGPSKVEQAIRIILETEPGERLMRPKYGCGLRRFIMQPNTSATRAQIEREVERALIAYEARINLTRVRAHPDRDPAVVMLHIEYTLARTGRPGAMVYPFYLEARS